MQNMQEHCHGEVTQHRIMYGCQRSCCSRRGVALSQPLEDSGVFPPLLCHMTRIGEETGNMEEMLEKVADYYDEEVEAATQAVTAIMEPLIIILMAAIVVPIMLAIMAPMMSIYSMAENS